MGLGESQSNRSQHFSALRVKVHVQKAKYTTSADDAHTRYSLSTLRPFAQRKRRCQSMRVPNIVQRVNKDVYQRFCPEKHLLTKCRRSREPRPNIRQKSLRVSQMWMDQKSVRIHHSVRLFARNERIRHAIMTTFALLNQPYLLGR